MFEGRKSEQNSREVCGEIAKPWLHTAGLFEM
jgi:hypothetical protein